MVIKSKKSPTKKPSSVKEKKAKVPSPTETIESSSEKKEELAQEITQLKEKNLRLLAEVENQKKTHWQEMQEIIKYSNEQLLKKLLIFPDNYQRALQAGQSYQDPKIQEFLTGFKMIFQEFQEVLKSQGVKEISVVPQKDLYSNKTHQVLEVVETNDYPNGTILEVLQKGYLLHQKVLSPTKVKISKKT